MQAYEEKIVSHTAAINAGRPHDRQIKWKYFQWLALLFTEVYLDRYFRDRAALLADLNQFVAAFNAKYDSYEPMTPYQGIRWMPKPLKGWLADHHVLFLDDGGDSYLKDLFERILAT